MEGMNDKSAVKMLLKNGKAHVRVDVQGGNTVWLNITRENEARIAVEMIEARISLSLPDPDVTFGEFADLYAEKHLIPVCAEETERSYRSALKLRLRPTLGKLRLSEINESTVEAYRAEWHGKVSNAVLNRDARILSAMLTKAVHWWYLKENPVLKVDELAA